MLTSVTTPIHPIDFSFLSPKLKLNESLDLSEVVSLIKKMAPYRFGSTSHIVEWLCSGCFDQFQVDTLVQALNLSASHSQPIFWLALNVFQESGFDATKVGIFDYSAMMFMRRDSISKETFNDDLELIINDVASMNYRTIVHLFSELERIFDASYSADTVSLRHAIDLIMLSCAIVRIYGTATQAKKALKIVWPLSAESLRSLRAMAQPFVTELESLVSQLPSDQLMKKSFRSDTNHPVTRELLLEAAIYRPKSTVHSFSKSDNDQSQAVLSLVSALKEKLSVNVTLDDGKKQKFFICTQGYLCKATSGKYGVRFKAGDRVISDLEIFTTRTERDYVLSGLKSSFELTKKYIEKARKDDPKMNKFAISCREANPWLEPYRNGLSTGSSVDGKVVTLRKVLTYASSSNAEKIITAINDRLPLKVVVNLSSSREGVFFSQVETDEQGNTVSWLAGWEERSRSGRGGKEYSYLLVNSNEFIGYDVD